MLKKGDLILFGVIIIIIASAFLISNLSHNNSAGKTAEIIHNGKVLRTFDLNSITKSEDITIDDKYHNIIRVEQGRIRFLESTCPDQICVKTGWLTSNGDIAVCLPNQAIIKITGKADNVDIVA